MLGLPFLQAPWWLAVSLASYTLAAAIWGILLPRLRPSVGTLVFAQRHLLPGQGYEPAGYAAMGMDVRKKSVSPGFLMTAEGMLIAASRRWSDG